MVQAATLRYWPHDRQFIKVDFSEGGMDAQPEGHMQKARKEEAVFVAITFGVTWLIWLGAYAISISANASLPFKDWLIRLGTAVPSVMGLVLAYVYNDETKSLKTLLRSLIKYKAPPAWWIYTIALFPLVLFISWLIFSRMGGETPPSQFPIWFIPLAFFYILVFMGPLGEELGWRGFLLDRLMRYGLAKAGSALGVIWFAWHIPLFFIQGTIQSELAKMGPGLALAGYLIYTTCISLLITVLYARTKGNLLLCVIFHTICNLSLGVAPLILAKSGAAVLLVVLILITALTVWLNRQKRKI